MSTQKDYDADCSIIKQQVSTEEFKTVIDSLRDEIANLKKEIESLKPKNKFIIDLVEFDEIDRKIEEEYKDFLINIKSLFAHEKWETIQVPIRFHKKELKAIQISKSDFDNYWDNGKINYYFARRYLYFYSNYVIDSNPSKYLYYLCKNNDFHNTSILKEWSHGRVCIKNKNYFAFES